MGAVIKINQKQVFDLEDAQRLLPVIKRITKTANESVEKLNAQMAFAESEERKEAIESQIQKHFYSWQQKIQRLGCHAKGLWLVDFDSGNGFYCWSYPETDISYFHSYDEGFRSREPIQLEF